MMHDANILVRITLIIEYYVETNVIIALCSWNDLCVFCLYISKSICMKNYILSFLFVL